MRSERSILTEELDEVSEESEDNGCIIDPKYKVFHEEITQNKVYKLSDLQYYDIYIMAVYYMRSESIKNLKAKKVGLLNLKSGITPGTAIGINHVMALLFYANFHRLQQEFKKLFHNRRDGDINKLYAKHGIIGHWSRYIYEAVCIFGDIYGERSPFLYTSINEPLLFGEWNISLKKPFSTTDDLWMMRKYVGKNGVILKLMYKQAARYFDLNIFTDFHNEKEKIFINNPSRFSVQNVILNDGQNLLDGMYAMELCKRILRGEVFSCFNKDIMSLKSQSILLHLVQNYMIKNIKNKHKYSSANKAALEYLSEIFAYMINKQFKYNTKVRIAINIDEIKKLQKNLAIFCYIDDRKKIGSFVREIIGPSTDDIFDNIIHAKRYEFMLFEDKWDQFDEILPGKTLKCGGFVYEMNDQEKYIINCEVGVDENRMNVIVFVKMTAMPTMVDTVYLCNDIILKETRTEKKYQKAYRRGDRFAITMCKWREYQNITTETLSFVMSVKIIQTIYK